MLQTLFLEEILQLQLDFLKNKSLTQFSPVQVNEGIMEPFFFTKIVETDMLINVTGYSFSRVIRLR